jgi:hypothetical protein
MATGISRLVINAHMSKERGLKRQHISHATIKLIGCKRFNLSIVLGFSHLCSELLVCEEDE